MLEDNSVALVTGAGRGIGRQVAIDLAAAGAAVALLSRSEAQLEEVAQVIRDAGGRAFVIPTDVTDRDALEAAVRRTEQELGPITLAVNNAGVDRPFGPVELVDPRDWWWAQSIHVLAPYIVMHAVLAGMRERGRGRVINVASSAANVIGVNASAYCVAKATLVRLTEHVDQEMKETPVQVFAIDPGTVMTDMGTSTLDDPEAQKWVPALLDHLTKHKDLDQGPVLRHLGSQFVALASGRYDELSGRFLNLELNLDDLLAEVRSQTPDHP